MTDSYGQPTTASLHVLCLHDGHSSAGVLHQKLHELDKRLYEKHGIELVYVNSPLRSSSVVGRTQLPRDEQPEDYVWWEESQDKSQQYVGLDASLLHLRQVWNTMPFCGILGVGQGAAVASLLPLLRSYPDLEFGIFWNGSTLLDEEERLIEDWPCLHLVDSQNDGTDRLICQFGGKIHNTSGSLAKEDLNVMGKFLVEQKKRLCGNTKSGENRLVLQKQLHLVEQEAARLVAEQVAENPPKALMAIISPQLGAMGAWSGAKRREPKEEGGGAPCPSEFLLQRRHRNAKDGGPSRHHPDEEEQAEDASRLNNCS